MHAGMGVWTHTYTQTHTYHITMHSLHNVGVSKNDSVGEGPTWWMVDGGWRQLTLAICSLMSTHIRSK